MIDYAQKIASLKLTLPAAPKPAGSYRPVVTSGNLAFLSGQLSRKADGSLWTGKAGQDLTLDEARAAAEAASLNVLSVIQNFIGFQSFERMLRVVGYVQAARDFFEISKVMDAASDLFLGVFGEQGICARTSVGMASLPLNAAVEIEATLQLKA